jgi:hypothetical protein
LERAPSSVADAGLSLLQRYVGICNDMERDPDEELLRRIHTILVSAGVLTKDDERE